MRDSFEFKNSHTFFCIHSKYLTIGFFCRKLMIITEGYINLGGQAFWDSHASSLESIVNLLVGNLSPRGMKYANLVFEALLKNLPLEGSSMFLSSGVITNMLKSFSSRFCNEKDSEPFSVIHIYLSVLSRVILALPTKIDVVLDILGTCGNFGLAELVRYVYLFFFHRFNFGVM